MQSDKILISVIIPIYNQELFLEEAIQSVLKQSYSFLELILVNDGSTDSSVEICKKYNNQYDNVYYIEQVNAGVSLARNKGLAEAKGSYVFFLDGDDTISEEFLEGALKVAIKNKSDFVVIGKDYCSRSPNIMALPTCAMFLKMDLLKKYPDIRFPYGIQPGEDGLFSHQLLALTNKVSLYPNGVYYYRQHENQNHIVINQNVSKVLSQIPQWLDLLKKIYLKQDLYKTHALHLALFIEHEPFEFRYLGMSLNNDQKEQLSILISVFMDENVLPYLSKQEKKKLGILFRKFLKLRNFKAFDEFYRNYKRIRERKFKVQLFLLKFIPFSIIRRALREEIIRNYYKI